MEVDKEFIREWVEALRSGEYEQGKEVLRDERDRFCCLGVACDLREDIEPVGLEFRSVEGDGLPEEEFIPPGVARKIGLRDTDQQKLSMRNDAGWSFEEIADYIEDEFLD